MKRSPPPTHARRWMSAVVATSTLAGSMTVSAVPRVASRDALSARYYIDVGSFTVATDATDPSLCALARSALVGRLAGDTSVVVPGASNDRGAVERTLSRYHLRGYFIDGRVRVVSGATASRVEVSLLVQTNPGREYRFESSVTVTLSGGDTQQREASIESATRRAVLAATTRAIGQLGAG